jgi:hypothetical protein
VTAKREEALAMVSNVDRDYLDLAVVFLSELLEKRLDETAGSAGWCEEVDDYWNL